MTAVISGTNGLLQSYDYQVSTTGFSYTFAAGTQVLVMNPAGTLATGTITMPASPSDGMVITFSSTQTITSLTINGNTSQTVVSKPNTLNANQSLAYVYRLSNTTWYPIGTQTAQNIGPTFSAYNTSAQALSASTQTKLQFNAEEFDTANCFDSTTNYRFTPNVAGYYQTGGGFGAATNQCTTIVSIYKNGSIIKQVANSPLTNPASYGSALVYLNGTTDYIELYGFLSIAQNTNTGLSGMYFQAVMVRGA
jgi:hypothetical protein